MICANPGPAKIESPRAKDEQTAINRRTKPPWPELELVIALNFRALPIGLTQAEFRGKEKHILTIVYAEADRRRSQ